MKKWQTLTATALLSASLASIGVNTYHAIQPTHYQGETFVNEKKQSHSSNSSSTSTQQSTSDSSSTAATTNNNTSVDTSASQPASVAQEQEPSNNVSYEGLTFRLIQSWENGNYVYDGQGNPVYTVYCDQSNDQVKNIPLSDAQPFMAWLYSITEGKHYMKNSMSDNYHYWVTNVKGQQ